MTTRTSDKIDFSKSLKDLYSATTQIKEVTAGPGTFLAIEGIGTPGGEAFQKSMEKIFGLVYTAKFSVAKDKGLDFKVSLPECLWFSCPDTPMEEWRWQLLIRIPERLIESDLETARQAVRKKKYLDTSDVKRLIWQEGRCLQTLHVGPYDQVGKTYEMLSAHARDNSLNHSGPAHEIYLNDPGRTEPEKLKTILRMPVSPA
jgi:hypothetical protein